MKTEYFFHSKSSPRTTVGGLYNPYTQTMFIATAICGPLDRFERKIGREITMGRIRKAKFTSTFKVLTQMGETPGKSFVEYALTLVNDTELVLESSY